MSPNAGRGVDFLGANVFGINREFWLCEEVSGLGPFEGMNRDCECPSETGS